MTINTSRRTKRSSKVRQSARMTLLGLALVGLSSTAFAEGLPADSIHLLDVVEISAGNAHRTTLTTRQPLSASVLSPLQLRRYDVADVTALTGRIPSLYIPDYGSRRSSAIYLRGVGARSSGQTIGFYVDGVPYLNKTTFNTDLVGLRQMEVLRGPQGTLYGRNAMAGAINLYTASAFDGERGEIRLRGGNYGLLSASALVHQRLGDAWGVSLGVSGTRRDGYWHNVTTGADQDSTRSVNGFARIDYRPNERFAANASLHFDHVKQGAFPYRRVQADGTVLPLDAGDPETYERTGLHAGLRLRWMMPRATVISSTGYQWMDDDTAMDMDGAPQRWFHVRQLGKQNAITQEVVVRNTRAHDRYQWSFGAFGFYDSYRLDVPVVLQAAGITQLIQRQIDRMLAGNPSAPYMKINASADVTNPNSFAKPEWGAALYHESTLRDILTPGLSVTAGLRLDYSHQQMDYDSELALELGVSTSGTAAGPFRWLRKPTHLQGSARSSALQLLPKLAIQYERDHWTVYASATKGFKSGGYNEQTLNDIVQQAQMQDLQSAPGRPGYDASGLNDRLAYGVETAWSYELGARLDRLGFLQSLTTSLYYMDVNNLQLTRFVASGAGRVISNAGSSHTLGAEMTARLRLADNLSATVSYGYTDARFAKRSAEELASGLADLSDKRVPFIPSHTYSAMLSAYETVEHGFVTSYFADLEVAGLGRIYWTEDNDYSQPGTYTIGGRLGAGAGRFTLSIWGKNLLGRDHAIFFFRSMGNSFTQLTAPRTFGLDLSYRL